MSLQKSLLLCGALGGPLFVTTFLILGVTRSGYRPLRQPVSALAMGPLGWMQQANFLVTAALMMAGAFGLHHALAPRPGSFWGPFFLGLYAIGLVGAGVFVTDITGLPSQAPRAAERSRSAVLHDLFSLVAFLALFIASFVFAYLFKTTGSVGWSLYSGASGVLLAVGFILFARAFSGVGALAPIAGLLQRLTIAIGWLWASIIALHVFCS